MRTINQQQMCNNPSCRKKVDTLKYCTKCGKDVCKDCISEPGTCKKCATN